MGTEKSQLNFTQLINLLSWPLAPASSWLHMQMDAVVVDWPQNRKPIICISDNDNQASESQQEQKARGLNVIA